MKRISFLLVAGAAATLIGCSAKTETASPASPAPTPATATPGTTAGTTPGTVKVIVVKKSDIIEQGDAICKKSNDANDGPKGDTPAEITTYLKTGLASSRADLKAIGALGTPDKDAGQLKTAIEDANTYFDQVEKAIPAFEKNPNAEIPPAMLKAQKTAEASAKDFGFKVCGAGASSSSSTTTTTA